MTLEMQCGLITFAEWLDTEEGARVGIITGAGEKSFISGLDLSGVKPKPTWFAENVLKEGCAAFEA